MPKASAYACDVAVLVDEEVGACNGTGRFVVDARSMESNVLWALKQRHRSVHVVPFSPDITPTIGELRKLKPRLVFNLTEWVGGNRRLDAAITGVLEMMNLRYTGAGPEGMQLARDKALAVGIVADFGVEVPRQVVVNGRRDLAKGFAYPLIVKPQYGDASDGMGSGALVRSREQLQRRVAAIRRHSDEPLVCEEFLPGTDLYVALLGNEPKVMPAIELVIGRKAPGAPRFATYNVKNNDPYRARWRVHYKRARITDEVAAKVREWSPRIFHALKLRDYARLDYRLTSEGRLVFLEANPNPDLARDSFCTHGCFAGVPYQELIGSIVRAALARPGVTLKPEIGVVGLWALAVGLVISGEYFGWSYGWAAAGTVGFLYTTLIVAVLYLAFIFSFTELTAAIPDAGGPFEYARRAFGPFGGLVAGYAALVEFALAPPAIAAALGAYVHFQFESVPVYAVGLVAFAVFVWLNILGVKQAMRFEVFVTVLAVAELLVFMAVVAPGFTAANFLTNPMPAGFAGVLAAIPFAIWFFLAIEGVAMAAEEVKEPRRTIPLGYISGILTLVVLAFGVMVFAGGAGDWSKLSGIDYPLPEAMSMIVGKESAWIHMLVTIGLFGLLASFHGIILSCSRQILGLARAGYLPGTLAAVHARRRTPHVALIATGIFGVIALASGRTSELITLSALGALAMYICSMLALFRLRRTAPRLERPFRAPLYPALPLIALALSVLSLGVIVWFNPGVSAVFVAGFVVAALYFRATAAQRGT